MNVEFKVLWFEDENDWYNMAKIRVEKIPKKSLLHQIQERDTTKIKLEKGFIVEIGASEHAFPAAWMRPSQRMDASRS